MRYLIVSIYDSCWNVSVCDSGIIYTEYNDILKIIKQLYFDSTRFEQALLEKYDNDYDFIAVCEDGNIEILKNNIKR